MLVSFKKKQVFYFIFRSGHRRCSLKKGTIRNFTKFTGKNLYQSLFFKKVADLTCIIIKKENLTQVFFCEFYEISKNIFFTEDLWTAASVF